MSEESLTFTHASVTLGLVTSSTPLPKTARHHKLWDSTVSSKALSHTTSTTSGEFVKLQVSFPLD